MKKDFVLDRQDDRVADASGFRGKSCAGDRVRYPRRSNLTQVANSLPLLHVKLCARGALKRRWAPQTRGTHKGYLSEYNKVLIVLI